MESLKEFFKPEFLNRLDDIVIFDTLPESVIKDIVVNQLSLVTQRLVQKNITVSYSKKLISHLAKKGFDPQYGARPLKRLIQNDILNQLAMQMIKKDVNAGAKIIIDIDKDEQVIIKKKAVRSSVKIKKTKIEN